jgi:hypothetical protein
MRLRALRRTRLEVALSVALVITLAGAALMYFIVWEYGPGCCQRHLWF